MTWRPSEVCNYQGKDSSPRMHAPISISTINFFTFDQAWDTCVSGFDVDTLVGLALITEELNTKAVAWPPPCPSWPILLTSWLKMTLLLSHRVWSNDRTVITSS